MRDCGALLNTLGLARRAGVLAVGQDKVFDLAKTGKKIVVIVTCDVSQNVLRTLKAQEEKGTAAIVKTEASRAALGAALGVQTAQVAAIEACNGFSNKILNFTKGSDADE